MIRDDPRYPYAYACDLLCILSGLERGFTKLSRTDASRLRQGIAKALGIDDAELAQKLADYYNEHQEELTITTTESNKVTHLY